MSTFDEMAPEGGLVVRVAKFSEIGERMPWLLGWLSPSDVAHGRIKRAEIWL
ncbi:MAG: hypothetical protein MI741_23135 [Rhodospirillales bacterium]|nr:hypothetical protein [Rhodospirillales bacterium]